jgi:hypothetical protein
VDDLIRVGLALDSEPVNQGVRQMGVSLEQGARQVDALQDRFIKLEQRFKLGGTSIAAYTGQLRTLKADISELNNTTRLGAEASNNLASISGRVSSQLTTMDARALRATNAMRQMTMGVSGLTNALQGGTQGVSQFAVGLASVGRGSVWVTAAVLGLTAIAELYQLVSQNAKQAREETEKHLAALSKIGANLEVGPSVTNAQRVAALQQQARVFRNLATGVDSNVTVPAPILGGREGTTVLNRTAIQEAQQLNLENERLRSTYTDLARLAEDRVQNTRRNIALLKTPRGRDELTTADISRSARGEMEARRNREALRRDALDFVMRDPSERAGSSADRAFLDKGLGLSKKEVEAGLAAEQEFARRRVALESRAAEEVQEKWKRVGGTIQGALNSTFDAVIEHQRNVWQGLFSWIGHELAKLAARKIATEVIGLVGFLTGTGPLGVAVRGDGGGGSNGGLGIAPQVAPSHMVFAPQVNLVSMETGRVTRSFTAEQRRYALRGGSVGPQSRIDIPVAAVVAQRG